MWIIPALVVVGLLVWAERQHNKRQRAAIRQWMYENEREWHGLDGVA